MQHFALLCDAGLPVCCFHNPACIFRNPLGISFRCPASQLLCASFFQLLQQPLQLQLLLPHVSPLLRGPFCCFLHLLSHGLLSSCHPLLFLVLLCRPVLASSVHSHFLHSFPLLHPLCHPPFC